MAADNDTDDIEYYVTFPAPTLGADADDEFNALKGSLQKNETAVMLVGWMGCEDKYLAKYSKIYESVGCTTIRYSPTNSDIYRGQKTSEVAKKLLDVLIEMNLSDNPVLFHIFSNGGCRLYNAMRNELQNNSSFEEIEQLGVVYDSAPGNPTVSQIVLSTFPANNPNMLSTLLKVGFYVFAAAYVGFLSLSRLFGWKVVPCTYDEMIYHQDGCPELYLFSKTDALIAASDVEYVITRRQMQGVDITFQCWDDSKHVQHFRTHREGYMKQCYDFLMKCLKRANDED
ncbi:transmembrane protein 53-B-like [Watersipora subatra]|uniref:transmembrane protein 53-B-like n=1 Tax=Watersipora subatra TaxID=2589382 RepID=UPI00355C5368